VNSGIIGELKRADFYIFIDFKRQLIGDKKYRGSLFTNQELAIAYLLDFEKVIFLQEQKVKLEGLLRYMGANPKTFTGRQELLSHVKTLVREKGWDPGYTRHLTVENLRGLPGIVTLENPFDHWHAKPFYVDVKNKRTDIGAERTQVRLVYVTDLKDGYRRRWPVRSPLKLMVAEDLIRTSGLRIMVASSCSFLIRVSRSRCTFKVLGMHFHWSPSSRRLAPTG